MLTYFYSQGSPGRTYRRLERQYEEASAFLLSEFYDRCKSADSDWEGEKDYTAYIGHCLGKISAVNR